MAFTTRIAQSACAAPVIILGTKSLWPGASRRVKRLLGVSKKLTPTSMVTPLLRSSSFSSSTHANAKEPLPCFSESVLYRCIVFLSMCPSCTSRWPMIVLLPASTWPTTTMLRCFFSWLSRWASISAMAFFLAFSDSCGGGFLLPGDATGEESEDARRCSVTWGFGFAAVLCFGFGFGAARGFGFALITTGPSFRGLSALFCVKASACLARAMSSGEGESSSSSMRKGPSSASSSSVCSSHAMDASTSYPQRREAATSWSSE
mmetsp:Transcript_2523/g.8969  ORF Transcript_2523/g.8969 Transcript_2523/m.8969 type:complete len:262 (-) Transcript_2523:346-1131(-)